MFHQVFELCDKAFQIVRKKIGSKRNLWDKLRTLSFIAIFKTWEQMLNFLLRLDSYDIVGGFVVERSLGQPPP